VTAGMVACIHYLGLEDCFDVVYGSSAGTVIGAYFITRQLPFFGPEVYYDSLTTAGKKFINTKHLFRSIGLGLLNPKLLKDVIFRRNNGKPVLDLDFLLKKTMQQTKLLDWEKFSEMQTKQPLKLVASALKQENSTIFDMASGHFNDLEGLGKCMHASCLLPGIAGPLMYFHEEGNGQVKDNFILKNGIVNNDFEPLADALIYEPLPFRSAVSEGATHVVMLRSRPDGVDVTGKSSLIERLVMKRFLLRKNKLSNVYKYMQSQQHKKLYAKQIIELNENMNSKRDYNDTSSPHIMTIAVPPGSPEVTKLEVERESILNGVRRGFARAYDALVEDENERGRGTALAKDFFPDLILDYNPLEIESEGSALDYFLKVKEESGEKCSVPSSFGKTALEAGLPR